MLVQALGCASRAWVCGPVAVPFRTSTYSRSRHTCWRSGDAGGKLPGDGGALRRRRSERRTLPVISYLTGVHGKSQLEWQRMAWRRPICLGLYLFALGSSNILTMGSMHARTVIMGAARLAFLTCNYGSNNILMGLELAAEDSGAGPCPRPRLFPERPLVRLAVMRSEARLAAPAQGYPTSHVVGGPSISCLREIAQVKASPGENAAETTGTRSGGSNCREGNRAVVVLFANHRPSIRAYSWRGGLLGRNGGSANHASRLPYTACAPPFACASRPSAASER